MRQACNFSYHYLLNNKNKAKTENQPLPNQFTFLFKFIILCKVTDPITDSPYLTHLFETVYFLLIIKLKIISLFKNLEHLPYLFKSFWYVWTKGYS